MAYPENQIGSQVIERICPRCGTVLKREWRACPNCGWTIAMVTPVEQQKTVSHGNAVLSIILGIVGFFIFGIILGFIGLGLGIVSVNKRDNWGYAGIILGVIVVIFSIIGTLEIFSGAYF